MQKSLKTASKLHIDDEICIIFRGITSHCICEVTLTYFIFRRIFISTISGNNPGLETLDAKESWLASFLKQMITDYASHVQEEVVLFDI